NGAPITSFLVAAQSSTCTVSNARSVSGSVTSAVISGLPAGSCNFTVRAINGFGYSSASSSTAVVTITGAPTTYSSAFGLVPTVDYRLGDQSSLIADSSGNVNGSGNANDAKTV